MRHGGSAAATAHDGQRHSADATGATAHSGVHHLVNSVRHHRGAQLGGRAAFAHAAYVAAVAVVDGAEQHAARTQHNGTLDTLGRDVNHTGAPLPAHGDGSEVSNGGAQVVAADRDRQQTRDDRGGFCKYCRGMLELK